MKKTVIGIIANSMNKNSENPFAYRYYTLNNYVKKIEENGGIAISILFNNDNLLIEKLELCDGILIPGGINIINDYQKVIDYVFKNDIPFLGICMGFQALGMYNSKNNLIKVDNHYDDIINMSEKHKLSHDIYINRDSLFYKIMKKERIKVNSLHHYQINKVSDNFKVVGLSSDNVIEVIEAKNKKFIIGTQFHPELINEFDSLFKNFIKQCKKE